MQIVPACGGKLKACGQTTFDAGHYSTVVVSMGCHLEKESDLIASQLELGNCGDKRTQIHQSSFKEA